MRRKRSNRGAKGFSLLEMMVVIAIIVIVGAVAIPWFAGMQRQNQVATVTRKVVGQLYSARVFSITGRQYDDGGTLKRANRATFEVVNATTIRVQVSDGTGTPLTVTNLDLSKQFPGLQAQISPTGTVEFFSDGSATNNIGTPLVISDPTMGISRQVTISKVGLIKVL